MCWVEIIGAHHTQHELIDVAFYQVAGFKKPFMWTLISTLLTPLFSIREGTLELLLLLDSGLCLTFVAGPISISWEGGNRKPQKSSWIINTVCDSKCLLFQRHLIFFSRRQHFSQQNWQPGLTPDFSTCVTSFYLSGLSIAVLTERRHHEAGLASES